MSKLTTTSSRSAATASRSTLPSFSKSKASTTSSTRPPGSSSAPRPAGRRSPSPKRTQQRASSPKRPRRPSPESSDLDDHDLFDSRRPAKKAKTSSSARPVGGSGFDIWAILNPGRDRSSYVARDIVSDDEDMEVDVAGLEREEARSRKIAKREEAAAEEEDRRHAAEKKRRKMERDRA